MGKKIAVDAEMLGRLLESYDALASLAEIVPEGCDQSDLPKAERGFETEYHRVDEVALEAVKKDAAKAVRVQGVGGKALEKALAKLEKEALAQAVEDVASAAGVSKKKAKEVVEASNLDDLPEADAHPGANFSYGVLFGVRDARKALGV